MTVRDRQNLLDQSRVIRLEKQVWGNTATRVGKLLEELVSSAVTLGNETQEWHVDDINGNDDNAGTTQGTALKTLAALKTRIATLQLPGTNTDIYIYPHSTVEGYSIHELTAVKPFILGGRCRIIGVGREAHPTAGIFTAETVDLSFITTTMTEDTGVADGLYAGWSLDVVQSVTNDPTLPVPEHTARDIIWHEGAEFQLRSTHYVAYEEVQTSSATIAGSTFRIARAAVAINMQDAETDSFAPTSGRRRAQIVGGPATGNLRSSPSRHYDGELQLINLHFRHPDGDTSNVHVSGFVRFIQCVISCDAAGSAERFWTFSDATVVSGHFAGYGSYGPGEYSGYNGLCSISRSPTTNPVKFGVWAWNSLLWGNFVLGQTVLGEGCEHGFTSYSLFDAVGKTSTYPHAALLLQGSHSFSSVGTTPVLFIRPPSSSSGHLVEVNGRGYAEFYRPIRIVGTQAISVAVRLRHNGRAEFGNAAGLAGKTDLVTYGLRLEYGSEVRVIGSGGQTLKQVIVGGIGANVVQIVDLATNPLVVGAPEIKSSDNSLLLRTG